MLGEVSWGERPGFGLDGKRPSRGQGSFSQTEKSALVRAHTVRLVPPNEDGHSKGGIAAFQHLERTQFVPNDADCPQVPSALRCNCGGESDNLQL